MASVPYISHSINGYSRYEVPESVAFTASAGILYPVRCDFLNARDIRYIQAGCVIRTNPALVPTFNPFRCSLHRFFCPIQLYHPEMRVNASQFDMQTMSTNCIVTKFDGYPTSDTEAPAENLTAYVFSGRDLISFLGLSSGERAFINLTSSSPDPFDGNLVEQSVKLGTQFVNADPILAYYDIIRSYYSFSQLDTVSLAIPFPPDRLNTATSLAVPTDGDVPEPVFYSQFITFPASASYYRQAIGSLKYLDKLFETCFYPDQSDSRRGLYYERTAQILDAVAPVFGAPEPVRSGTSVTRAWFNTRYMTKLENWYTGNSSDVAYSVPISRYWVKYLPYGVAPSVADRFSRLLDLNSTPAVSLSNVSTIRGLAFASKLQSYIDLLGSGGSRFSDWLRTFFAAKVSHVDRPVLVYSSSFYLNSRPIFSQQGGDTLGKYAGVIDGQDTFGKKAQRYCFDEPGYLMDIFCVRPVYYWAGIQKDFARYDKMDYFNPIFNEVGYEDLPGCTFGLNRGRLAAMSVRRQPCYNEFRASYDRVLGDFALVPGQRYSSRPLLSTWVQQRAPVSYPTDGGSIDRPEFFEGYLRSVYFTDIEQANSIFASTSEDNFFVNLYYNVTSKSLVSKNFATNLATR